MYFRSPTWRGTAGFPRPLSVGIHKTFQLFKDKLSNLGICDADLSGSRTARRALPLSSGVHGKIFGVILGPILGVRIKGVAVAWGTVPLDKAVFGVEICGIVFVPREERHG